MLFSSCEVLIAGTEDSEAVLDVDATAASLAKGTSEDMGMVDRILLKYFLCLSLYSCFLRPWSCISSCFD